MDAPKATGRHVLFLNWRDTGHPEGGGSEVYVERISAQLAARGDRATVFCARYEGASRQQRTVDGVDIVRRGGRLTVYLWAALVYLAGVVGVGPLARRRLGRPDLIVDVGNGVPFLSAVYARVPVIALVHHVHREQWPVVLGRVGCRIGWWIESKLAPWVYRHCRYVTVSEASRADLTTLLGVDADRITVVYNGTAAVVGAPIPRDPQPHLVVLGRLVPHKRVEIALRTVAALTERLPTLTLTVAGQGWWEPQLRSLTDELGIADRVRFTGYVDEAEKHELFCRAWLALTPSLKEGWGLTIVEAGARGTPTVAFASAGGVAEALVDGESGLIAQDEANFVALVGELLEDDVRREAMGVAAGKHALSFTWEHSGARFAALVPTPATAGTAAPVAAAA